MLRLWLGSPVFLLHVFMKSGEILQFRNLLIIIVSQHGSVKSIFHIFKEFVQQPNTTPGAMLVHWLIELIDPTHCAPLERGDRTYRDSIDISLLWSERLNPSTLRKTDGFLIPSNLGYFASHAAISSSDTASVSTRN